MPTKSPPGLLDHDLAKAQVREWIGLTIPLLQEVVNYSLAAFTRCLKTDEGNDSFVAPLLPYLHLLEMIDGVQILLAELGTQFLECCDWNPPLNRYRFAEGLDALNLMQGLCRKVRLTTVRARPQWNTFNHQQR
jgi:hypothetical protein